MNIEDLNKQLDLISASYIAEHDYSEAKKKLEEDIIKSNSTNEKLNSFNDINMFVNKSNDTYNPVAHRPQLQHPAQSPSQPQHHPQSVNSLNKRSERESINHKLSNLNFNETTTGKSGNIYGGSSTVDLIGLQPVHSKNTRAYNRDINGQRLSQYSPLGRSLGLNYVSMHQPQQQQPQHQPQQQTPQYQEPLRQINSRDEIIKTQQQTKYQQNFNDVNPHYRNSYMTEYPVDTNQIPFTSHYS